MEENNIYIGQASQLLNCNRSLLRFYENEFELDIPRNQSGRRLYGRVELDQFRFIDNLKKEGYNNTQIKHILAEDRTEKNTEDAGVEDISCEKRVTNSDVQEILALIGQLKNELTELKTANGVESKELLLKENEELKRKLKEKTYELVETKEKLTNLKKYGSKKMFKI